MSRLIDAIALDRKIAMKYLITKKKIRNGQEQLDNLAEGYIEVCKLIENAPTVDAVEVVRCKKCKHGKIFMHGLVLCERPIDSNVIMTENSFCSYGEKTDGT